MSRTDWPKLCTIAEAARLFTDAGHPIDRSNLSKWISNRKIAGEVQGKRTVYDPGAVFDAWSADFGRNLMAGRTGGAAVTAPKSPTAPLASSELPERDDPNRDLKRIQARQAALELERDLGRTLAVEEVAAGLAASLAELRATSSLKARDEARILLAELGLPGSKIATLTAGLKRFSAHLQEAWAAKSADLLAKSSTPDTPARQRLEALAAFDLDLRGETGGEGEDEHEPDAEPAPAG